MDCSAPLEPPPPPIDAGPTAVHCWLETASAWPRLKIRKLVLMLSLFGSPSPVVGTGFWKVSDQLLSVPVPPLPVLELVMMRVQVPLASRPANAESGICGLNVPKNGAAPFWMGVPARSSNFVLVKLACVEPPPTPLKSGTATWLGPL